MSNIIGKDRYQIHLESIDDYIDENNTVRVIDKLVDSLNLTKLNFKESNNIETGRPNYSIYDILKLYFYGYYNGIRSSRKLEKQAIINKEVIWLIKGLQPKYRTIADFRKDNAEALKSVFELFVDFCDELGLYGKSLVAIDGTKIEASASKRKHIRKNKINVQKQKVQNKISEYIHDLEVNDRLEDNDEAKKFKKEELEAAIEKLKKKMDKYDAAYKELEEKKIDEINRTDPDAKTVKFGANQGTDIGYNIEAAVDDKNKLIVSFDVINNSADQGQLYNMSKKVIDKFNLESIETLADKGFYETNDVIKCEENGIKTYVSKPYVQNSTCDTRFSHDKFKYIKRKDVYICPEGNLLECTTKKKNAAEKSYSNFGECSKCKYKANCTIMEKGRILKRKPLDDILDVIQERLKNNMDKYKSRQTIVEHPFGTLKRAMNFYYLLTRGFRMATGEVSLAFFSYNLKRVISILGVDGIIAQIMSSKTLRIA